MLVKYWGAILLHLFFLDNATILNIVADAHKMGYNGPKGLIQLVEPQKTLEKNKLYSGKIFDLFQYKVRLPSGKETHRDILEHNGAAVILAVTDDGDLVMVRQFRNGSDSVMLELPAGKLDLGEDPITCAIRELEEETGYRAAEMKPLLKMHPVAAYCTEQISLFLALGLKKGEPTPDADEFVEVELHSPAALLDMIDNGEITDMKTIASILYYLRSCSIVG